MTGREGTYYVQSALGVWRRWLLATLFGFALGVCGWISFTFPIVDGTDYSFLGLSVTAALQGVSIGVLQWDVLRHRVYRAYWWIPATSIGWGVGVPTAGLVLLAVPANGLLVGIAVGLTIGIVVGVAQWLVLRGKVQRAIVWIPANVISRVISTTIIWSSPFDARDKDAFAVNLLLIGGGALSTIFTALINGTVLVWLLRQSDQSHSV